MIGDWVLYEGEPYQIRRLGIYGVDRDGEDYPAVCVGKPTGIGLIVERNEIEPIPLTAEILEKNGFVLKPDGWIWCDCEGIEDQNYIFIQFRKGCDEVRRCEINYVNKTQATYYQIKYVHQLQHALKLCGIEKEIEL